MDRAWRGRLQILGRLRIHVDVGCCVGRCVAALRRSLLHRRIAECVMALGSMPRPRRHAAPLRLLRFHVSLVRRLGGRRFSDGAAPPSQDLQGRSEPMRAWRLQAWAGPCWLLVCDLSLRQVPLICQCCNSRRVTFCFAALQRIVNAPIVFCDRF